MEKYNWPHTKADIQTIEHGHISAKLNFIQQERLVQ